MTEPSDQREQQRPSRILFGSCTSQHYSQPLWPNIRNRNATAFVWGGDAMYADKTHVREANYSGKRRGTPQVLRDLYHQQLSHPEYNEAINEMFIYGTIDDHDYGIDNGDETYVYKKEAAIEFVETFLRFDPESAMAKRARSGAGVYGVKVFDFSRAVGQEVMSDEEAAMDPDVVPTPEDEIYWSDAVPTPEDEIDFSDRSVAVFVLDVRSHRTPYTKHLFKRFSPDYEGDFLGEAQWEWFQEAISRSKAAVNMIVTGLTVHTDKWPDPNVAEAWARFPTAQNRLYQLLLESNIQSPILVSGDVHYATLSLKHCKSDGDDDGTVRRLFEMTTSGMTHSWKRHFFAEPKNPFLNQFGYFPWGTNMAMTLGHWINPWTEIIDHPGLDGAKSGLQYTLDLNFGEFEFDWENRNVHARVHGVDSNKPLLSINWKMDEFGSRSGTGQWQCINYRGPVDPVQQGILQGVSVIVLLLCVFLPTIIAVVAVFLSYQHYKYYREISIYTLPNGSEGGLATLCFAFFRPNRKRMEDKKE